MADETQKKPELLFFGDDSTGPVHFGIGYDITDLGTAVPYAALINRGTADLAAFHASYEAGLRARFKLEAELNAPYEACSKEKWDEAAKAILHRQEKTALSFYMKVHQDFADGKYVGEVVAPGLDYSALQNIRHTSDGYLPVVIHPHARWKTKGKGRIIDAGKSGNASFGEIASGWPITFKREDGSLAVYDARLAGFARAVTADRDKAVESQVPFMEQLGCKSNPREAAEREVSYQWCPERGSGQRVTMRVYWHEDRGPRHIYAGRLPVESHAEVGRRLFRTGNRTLEELRKKLSLQQKD